MHSGSRHVLSTVEQPDEGGQGGYFWSPSASLGDGSIWVAHDAVPPISNGNAVFMPSPNPCDPGVACGNFLYAPTTHGSNGNCMEVTSAYSNVSNNPGFTNYYILLTDFCYATDGHQEFVQLPMDSNFFNSYVEIYNNGDGRPEYCVEVLKDGAYWRVLLYNNLLKKYDDIYDAFGTGNNNGQQGWSMYETHYNFQVQAAYTMPCPSNPNIGASGIRINPNGIWQKIGGLAQPGVRGNPAQCFSPNSTEGDVYSIQYNGADSAWVGISSNNGRNPSSSSVGSGGGVPGSGGGVVGGGGCTKCPPTN